MIQSGPRRNGGAALIEVLVAMLIVAFGVLGLVGLQAKTTVTALEAYQRSQALILAGDIAQRINLNRASAAAYVASNIGATDPGNCLAMTGAEQDLCEWAKLIRGSAETDEFGTEMLGAMKNARACITSLGSQQYLIAVVWQGIQATGPAPVICGTGAYPDENLRRAVTTVVRIGTLS